MRLVAIVPAYNAGRFLRPAVESLLTQTAPTHIIVINDGSTDGSIETIREFAATGRIELIDRSQNIGKPDSLNQAIDDIITSDRFDAILLQDADDISLPTRVERQVHHVQDLENWGCTASYLRYMAADGRSIGVGKTDILSADDQSRYLAGNEPFGLFCPAAMMSVRMLRETGLRFRKQFWPADDLDMWNRVAEQGWQVRTLPEELVMYRIHGGSAVTSNFMKTRMQFEFMRACLRARRTQTTEPTREEFLEAWHNIPWHHRLNRWRKLLSKELYRTAGFAVAERKYLKAGWALSRSLLLQPGYALPRLMAQQGRRIGA
ncbi:MAG: glycosyltransferase [Planctomycetes bacterium]|nr:glycosyltransferase [Planctomycetota bacterium]